jgi:hypothetical protein
MIELKEGREISFSPQQMMCMKLILIKPEYPLPLHHAHLLSGIFFPDA